MGSQADSRGVKGTLRKSRELKGSPRGIKGRQLESREVNGSQGEGSRFEDSL